jgi:hypothetical protein
MPVRRGIGVLPVIRPPYAVLAAAYPRKKGPQAMDAAALYTSIGHPEYASTYEMQNTCAVRVSIALLAAGIQPFPGHMTVKAGKFTGKRIEQSQKRLSEFLAKRLGAPEVYKNGYNAWRKIRPRRGIVSFYHINGGDWDPQGHIDLVGPARANDVMYDLQCAMSCYWSSAEVWFWPLR